MRIVVAGGGMVGGGLVHALIEHKHDVVLVDEDQATCDRLYAETGVVAIQGNVARTGVLKEAEVSKADVFVAATGDDAVNLVCAILARSEGVPRIIARMRDPEYERGYRLAGVSSVIRVTDLMVNQMLMEVERPPVRRITSIGKGRADIFALTVPRGAKVDGQTVQQIAESATFPSQCVFVGVFNPDTSEFAIPRGQLEIRQGMDIFLVSPADEIHKAAEFLTAVT